MSEMLQRRWRGSLPPRPRWTVSVELVWRSTVDRATRVPAQIWAREAVGINPSRQHGSTESRRKRGGSSSINQCSFSRNSRERESIARVLQRSDARQTAGDVLVPTWRLDSTMRIPMGCSETVVLGIPKPRTAKGNCVLSGEPAFRRAGGDVRRVFLRSSARRSLGMARGALLRWENRCVEVTQRAVLFEEEEESQRKTASDTL